MSRAGKYLALFFGVRCRTPLWIVTAVEAVGYSGRVGRGFVNWLEQPVGR